MLRAVAAFWVVTLLTSCLLYLAVVVVQGLRGAVRRPAAPELPAPRSAVAQEEQRSVA